MNFIQKITAFVAYDRLCRHLYVGVCMHIIGTSISFGNYQVPKPLCCVCITPIHISLTLVKKKCRNMIQHCTTRSVSMGLVTEIELRNTMLTLCFQKKTILNHNNKNIFVSYECCAFLFVLGMMLDNCCHACSML